jgi:hypothetical protein
MSLLNNVGAELAAGSASQDAPEPRAGVPPSRRHPPFEVLKADPVVLLQEEVAWGVSRSLEAGSKPSRQPLQPFRLAPCGALVNWDSRAAGAAAVDHRW